MQKTVQIVFVVAITILGSSIVSAGNPGTQASSCISESNRNGNTVFENNCGEKAFVIYCGDLKYTKKKCGEGSGYYTHSFNLESGARNEVATNGYIKWGACLGGVGFGRDEFSDSRNGDYTCKRTGR